MTKIESIFRYPIKGLSGEQLESVTLTAGNVVPGDREYAFARAGVSFDPETPEYLQKTNFLALVRDEQLAKFNTVLDHPKNVLSIFQDQSRIMDIDLGDPNDCHKAAQFFRDQLALKSEDTPRLVRAAGGTDGAKNSHSFSDVPDKAISLINLKSVSAFGEKVATTMDPMRFRGNINFLSDVAWEEFDWIDRDLQIGDAVLRVFKRTQRCAATTVNPATAVRDINVPKELYINYDHMDMGIYALVVNGGEIKAGDEIKLI